MKILVPLVILLSSVVSAVAQDPQDMDPIPTDNGVRPEILNGRPAVRAEWPVTLQFTSAGGACTSTLIGDRAILTAAHCIDNNAKARILYNNAHVTVTCAHHPGYRGKACLAAKIPADIVGCTADVALCVPDKDDKGKEVRFSIRTLTGDRLKFESINKNSDAVKIGSSLTLLGFGCLQKGGPISEILHTGDAAVESVAEAGVSKANPSNVMKEYITALGGAAVCQGDSGGAAYSTSNMLARAVIGVNSRGNISSRSYLTSVSDEHIRTWFTNWSKDNNAKICGLHDDALGCKL
jgi:hypothetical protein